MTWPFDDDSALPLHDGIDVGGAQERQMAAVVGGYGGIRTVEENNPDGSITTLRTRGGNPIFETVTARQTAAPTDTVRGFVAKASSRAVLFDPYTLDVLNANYSPALNTYAVQHFATAWNVPALDDTHWYDVVLFDGATIKVNAKAMPTLGITANHGFPAIPYVINRATAEDQYGNAERNVTEKRVFAVGRSDVKDWGGGGVVETLTPSAPRSEGRSMTIGQRVDRATNKAWIGQIYHPAAGWDAAGEWAFTSAEVTMLLTAPYLSKVGGSANVAMSVATLGSVASSSGTKYTDVMLPPTEVGLSANGEVSTITPYTSNVPNGGGGNNGYYSVRYPWSGTISRPLIGTVIGAYSRTQYSGYESGTATQAGVVLSYSAVNDKKFDTRNDSPNVKGQTVWFADEADTDNIGSADMTGDADNLYWGQHFPPIPTGGLNAGPPGPYRGRHDTYVYGSPISGSACTRFYEDQSGAMSVSMPSGDKLVDVVFSRNRSYGPAPVYNPVTGYYDAFLANPYGLIGVSSGMGVGNFVRLQAYTAPSTDETWIRKYHGTFYSVSGTYWQPQEAVDTINAKYSNMHNAFVDQVYLTSEFDSGINRYNYYTASINPSVTLDDSTMSWSSKDYLLYDETNGVFISVEATFSGVNTAASLDVILKVQTRFHTTTQVLGHFDYTYSQLVQEREIGSTGKFAMPSPKIRAIFAPLYQEQGSFKGAHYVTQLEESNGATPAHLFNFLLRLRPYSGVGTVNDDNLSSRDVHFVPCNLLEMLYAFVFSQEYGVAASGERYPVTFTARYNDMMATLFSTPVRVAIRDGAQGVWSDAFGPDFASISTVSLHRA